jgi:predicted metalloprotease with PDZ domain
MKNILSGNWRLSFVFAVIAMTVSAADAQSVVVVVGDVSMLPPINHGSVVVAPIADDKPILGIVIADSLLGVEITHVAKGSPADRAGLTAGDHLVEINDVEVEHPRDVVTTITRHPPRALMKVAVLRRNQRLVRRFQLVTPVAIIRPGVVDGSSRFAAP